MGLLSAAMKAELKKASPSVYPVCEVTFPDGVERWGRAEPGGVGSDSLGMYQPRVKRFGTIGRSAADRQNALSVPVAKITIDDTDQAFAKRLGKRQAIHNIAVSIKLASANVAPADWYERFAGRLHDWEHSGELEWTLSLRANDAPLNSMVPRTFLTIEDWPDIHSDAKGVLAPLVYGLHDKSTTGNDGAVPCPYVDTAGFRYVVCLGRAKSVLRVYVDGVRQSSGFSITYPKVAGKRWTLVDFTADQLQAEVTVDVEGYETVGDGTGTLITDPAEQAKHFLVNFVYNDYQTGAWFADASAPVDAASAAVVKTFWAKRAGGKPYSGGRYIDKQAAASHEINLWTLSHEAKVVWSPSGKLAFKVRDPHVSAYVTDPVIVYPHDVPPRVQLGFGSQDTIRRVFAAYGYSQAAGKYLYSLEVIDPAAAGEAAETIEMAWGPAFE